MRKKLIAMLSAAALMIAAMVPSVVLAAETNNGPTLAVNINKTINSGEPTEFTVTTTKGNDTGTMVMGKFDFSSAKDSIEKLEYLETQNNTWYELTGDTFGPPATGFPLMDATSKFRVKFKDGVSGEFPYTVSIVKKADNTNVLSVNGTVKVLGNPTVKIDTPEQFVVGEAAEFTVSTTAGKKAGTMVLGKGTFDGTAAIEKVEYLETRDNKWYELKGDTFGPASGFPMTDTTSKFRVTFKSAGTFNLKVDMTEVNGGAVIASDESTINVVAKTVTENPAKPSTDKEKSPETGDNFNIAPFIAIMAIAGVAGTFAIRRKFD